MSNSKVIYPYVRFSKREQKNGTSYERQMELIEKYARENDFEINDTLNLKDLGLSAFKGKNKDKGALGAFLKAIKTKSVPVDGSAYLCIEQFDRLSREDVDSAYQLFRSILMSNVNIITLMDNRTYTKESLNEMVSITYSIMLMSQANAESQKKSERISEAYQKKLTKIKNGESIKFAARMPAWITNEGTKDNRQFVLNEKAKVVQRIFKLYLDEISMGEIAKTLNSENVSPLFEQRNSINQWSSGNVSSILRNRSVTGDLYIRKSGDLIKNYYPAVVSFDDFESVEALRNKKKTLKRAGKQSINVFTGKLFCVECGRKYYFRKNLVTYKGEKRYYNFLTCSGKRNGGQCNSLVLRYEDFLEAVKVPLRMRSNPDTKKVNQTKGDIKEVRVKIRVLEKELLDLEKLFDNEEINMTVYAKTSSKIDERLKGQRKHLASLARKISLMENEADIDHFDIEDREQIAKIKKFIGKTYAAFFISSQTKSVVCLDHSGGIILNEFKHKKSLEPDTKSIDAMTQFFELKEQIIGQYKRGEMDSRFMEVLEATSFWDIDSAERVIG